MTKVIYNSKQNQNQRLKQFRFRLTARIVVILVSFALTLQRMILMILNPEIDNSAAEIFKLTLPFLFGLSVVAFIEYLLFRKYGLSVLKYSKVIDLFFVLIYTGEWLLGLYSTLQQHKNLNYQFPLASLISMAAFSWRTLIQLLITQYWPLKTIAPVSAYILLLCFGVVHQPGQVVYILLRGIFPALFIILIFYFDHKVNFMMVIGNIQQEQWLQLNEFILNNIPENIVIMDLEGNCSFTSEHFKKLIMKLGNSLSDVQAFFRNIKDIQQQENENETCEVNHVIEISATRSNQYRFDGEDLTRPQSQRINSLEDLIHSVSALITRDNIQEKSFQVFNGKFKQESQENNTEERSFEIKVSSIKQESKRYILVILRDTTHRDQILTLEGNIKYKDRLLASVSHELRTPLNGNINLLEAAIKSKDVCDQIKERLLIPAVKSSKFLLHLINDILDMSQIKAQKLRLVFQSNNLKETLINTIQLLELHAKKKGVTLKTEISPDLPHVFCTDHVRLSQIILNLLNNSIKFTERGSVKLKAWPLEDMDSVKVSVEDSGIGMTEEDKHKLFKEFTHIDHQNRESLNPTGIGLGLKIANDLSKLLGPKETTGIKVNSALGKGSKFSFIIENKEAGLHSIEKLNLKEEQSPLVADEYPIDTEISLTQKVLRLSSAPSLVKLGQHNRTEILSIGALSFCSCPKILVVDDDPFNILAYEAILNALDQKSDYVYSGRSAIDKMLNRVRYPCSSNCQSYKIVFMDEEMPGMSGKETVSEIISLQSQSLLPHMNIVGCTAHSDGEEIEKILKSGVVEYLPKPISLDLVKKILEKYIDCI